MWKATKTGSAIKNNKERVKKENRLKVEMYEHICKDCGRWFITDDPDEGQNLCTPCWTDYVNKMREGICDDQFKKNIAKKVLKRGSVTDNERKILEEVFKNKLSWSSWSNKLADFEIRFKSRNDEFSRDIRAKCSLESASDTYHIEAWYEESPLFNGGQRVLIADLYLDDDIMKIIIEFAERLSDMKMTNLTK